MGGKSKFSRKLGWAQCRSRRVGEEEVYPIFVQSFEPRTLGCETRSVVIIVTELSSSYFDLDAGSWSSDDRRAENFDKRSAELSVLLLCDTGLPIDSHQTFRYGTVVSSSRVELSTKTQKIFVVRNCHICATYDMIYDIY